MADKTLSSLTDGGVIAAGDVLKVVRGGNSRKATFPTLAATEGRFLLRDPNTGNYYHSSNLRYNPSVSPPQIVFGIEGGGPVDLRVQHPSEPAGLDFTGFHYRGADNDRTLHIGGGVEASHIGDSVDCNFGRATGSDPFGPPSTFSVGDVALWAGQSWVTGVGFKDAGGAQTYVAALVAVARGDAGGAHTSSNRPGALDVRVTPPGSVRGPTAWRFDYNGSLYAEATTFGPGSTSAVKIGIDGGGFGGFNTGLYWIDQSLHGAPMVSGEQGVGFAAQGSRRLWVSSGGSALQTALSVGYRDAGGNDEFARITLGAADSAGAGFRLLRVPNG